MKKHRLTELIDKYLAGKCNVEETFIVEKWYETHSETEREFYDGQQSDVQQSRDRSLSELRQKLGIVEKESAAHIRRAFNGFRWVAAASVFLVTSVLVILYLNSRLGLTYTTFSTKPGEVKHIHLPDGSEVWLNAGSTLRFAENYNKKSREVYLSGEGYFDVKHNVLIPFNVYAGKIKTHVLGTSFSVSSYPGAINHTVTITRGKVQVSDDHHLLGYLTPDQELQYSLRSGNAKIIHTKAEDVTSWRRGKLVFIDMPMQDIAVHLQTWYGVKYEFKNHAILSKRFTASFNNNIGIGDLLNVMNEVTHAHYKFNEQNKTIIDY